MNVANMYTTCLKLKLKPDCYEGYKKAHDELWPEVAESMKRCGVSMAIFRDDQDLLVFAVAPTEADWLRSRQYPILEEWNIYMTKFLETDDSGGIAFTQLEKAFVLEEKR